MTTHKTPLILKYIHQIQQQYSLNDHWPPPAKYS